MNEEISYESECKSFQRFMFLFTFLAVASLIFIGMIGVGSAVSCDGNMNGTNGYGNNPCTIATTLTLNGSYVFTFNGTTSGVIQITGSNLEVDGNGSTFIGNGTTGLFAIRGNTLSNVTIKNFIFQNYDTSIRMNGNNNKFNNNTFNSSITQNIYFLDSINQTIANNSISNRGIAIYCHRNCNSTVIENNLINGTRNGFQVNSLSNYYNIVRHNTFINMTDPTTENFAIRLNVGTGGGSLFYNNTFILMDTGIFLTGVSNFSIQNNTFSNVTTGADAFLLPIRLLNGSDIEVLGNTLNDLKTTGLWARNVSNLAIKNNIFNMMNLTQDYVTPNHDYGDTRCTIMLAPVYKGISNTPPFIPITSTNITLTNNSYNSNTECYLRSNNVDELSTDFTSFWYRSFQAPTYLYNRDHFWMNLAFDNMSNNYNRQNFTWLFNGAGSLVKDITYNISKNEMIFTNSNQTATLQVNVYNQTNALFHNGTGICTGSSANINDNDGNINLTLNSNKQCIILDRFNLTEGITRQNSPLSISGSTTSKTITSTLGQSINATVVASMPDCSTVSELTYSDLSFTGAGARVVCTSLASGGYVLEVDSGDNLLELTLETSAHLTTMGPLILLVVIISLVVANGILFNNIKDRKSNMKQIIIVFLIDCIGIALIVSMANTIATW